MTATDTPKQAESQFLDLARRIDKARHEWEPALHDTGELDVPALERMTALRQELICQTPVTAVDALILCSALRCVASFLFRTTSPDDEDADPEMLAAHISLAFGSATELVAGLHNLSTYLQEQSGHSVESLGLFTTKSDLH